MTVDENNTQALRKLKTTLAMFAQESGDIFLSWRGPGCDVILGIDQATETDVLRALQWAWKTAKALAETAPRNCLKGALAAGLAVASMFRNGGWSGEAIASSAIVLARQRTHNAHPGMLFLDATALDVLHSRGAFAKDEPEAQLPLNDPDALHWHISQNEPGFQGRETELDALGTLFQEEEVHCGATVFFLSGEAGSGKSRLCKQYAQLSRKKGRDIRLFRCLPAAAQRPVLEVSSRSLLEWNALGKKLEAVTRDKIAIIDDAHWLGNDALKTLVAQALQNKGKNLFVQRNQTAEDKLALAPLPKTNVKAMVLEMLAAGQQNGSSRNDAVQAVVDLAGGNPLFAVELARHQTAAFAGLTPIDRQGKKYLPLSIVTLVTACLDQWHLDHRMLRIIASSPKEIGLRDLAHALGEEAKPVQRTVTKALRAGVLKKTKMDHFGFAHPMFHNVINYLGMES
ncbi:MAG TPA: ATP-binding protein [Desulfonatronum sp.]|nr:ATP-binding protein [Desulfonatronum sp.]